jgi:hypothetical protein
MKKQATPLTINAVLIRTDGLTLTFTSTSWIDFAAHVVAEAERGWWHRAVNMSGLDGARLARIFASSGERLQEYTVAECREELGLPADA